MQLDGLIWKRRMWSATPTALRNGGVLAAYVIITRLMATPSQPIFTAEAVALWASFGIGGAIGAYGFALAFPWREYMGGTLILTAPALSITGSLVLFTSRLRSLHGAATLANILLFTGLGFSWAYTEHKLALKKRAKVGTTSA